MRLNTKPDIIGRTDFEFQRVALPQTNNYRCIENRMNIDARCGANDMLRVGSSEGSCDIPQISNYKLVSTGLYKLVHADIPDALRSPPYDVVIYNSNTG